MTLLPTQAGGETSGIRTSALFVFLVSGVFPFAWSVARSDQNTLTVHAAANIALICAATASQALYRPLDLTNPIHWVNGSLAIMYGVHPLAFILTGQLGQAYHEQFSLSDTYSRALTAGTVSILATNLGYSLTHRQDGVAGTVSETISPEIALRCARAFGVIGFIGLGFFSALTPKSGDGLTLGESSSAYLYMTPYLLLPSGLLLLHAFPAPRHPARRLGYLFLASLLLDLFFLGHRYPLIVVGGAIGVFLAVSRRIHVNRPMALACVVAGLFLLGALRDVNGPGASFWTNFSASIRNPSQLLEKSMTGEDTEMIDALALEMRFVPEAIPHKPGAVLKGFLSAPIPRKLWNEKPVAPDVTLNSALFNRRVNQPSIAYALVGEAYYDSGFIGVALSMGLLGLICARLNVLRRRSGAGVLLYSVGGPLVAVLTRGSWVYIVAYGLAFMAPILLAHRLGRSKSSSVRRVFVAQS